MLRLRHLAYATIPVCVFAALYFIDRAGDTPTEAAVAPLARTIDPFLGVQQSLLNQIAMRERNEADDIPLPTVRYYAADCVVSFKSDVWTRLSDVQDRMAALKRELETQYALTSGKPPPAETLPPPAEDPALLQIENLNRFDLRAFDLSAVESQEREGLFFGVIRALPYEGGGDATNLSFVEAWAANADTEKEKAGTRRFGQTGRMKYRLAQGQPSDPLWVQQRDTFMALREALLDAEDATNITVTTMYTVTQDGARLEYSGHLAQPKRMAVYASSSAEFDEQIGLLRQWKTEQGCQ